MAICYLMERRLENAIHVTYASGFFQKRVILTDICELTLERNHMNAPTLAVLQDLLKKSIYRIMNELTQVGLLYMFCLHPFHITYIMLYILKQL